MQSQIVTALIAVVPSLLVLVIQQFFNVLTDKRAFKEHVLDNLIPERRKFYGDLMTFVTKDLRDCVLSQELTAQNKVFQVGEKISGLYAYAIPIASKEVCAELVRFHAKLIGLQTMPVDDDAAVQEHIEAEFSSAVQFLQNELYILIRKECLPDTLDGFLEKRFRKTAFNNKRHAVKPDSTERSDSKS